MVGFQFQGLPPDRGRYGLKSGCDIAWEGYQMQKTIETHLPHLSQPQLTGLALWVCGAILAGSACQNAVASALSPWSNWYNLRQRLREWLYDGGDRATPCQSELDVTLCFAPLLRWVLTWWQSGGLALAIDPTLKGDQTTAIVISVLYRSCAIPVAWHIRHADQPGSWMDPTVELLMQSQDSRAMLLLGQYAPITDRPRSGRHGSP